MFAGYVRLWSLSEAVILASQRYLFPDHPGFWPLAVWSLMACAFLCPKWFAAPAVLSRWLMIAWKAPWIWTSNVWGLQTELTFLYGCLWFGATDRAVSETSWILRWQLGLFYAAAGFWKLNSAFLDPTSSCATVVTVQLFAEFWPSVPVDALLRPVVLASPWLVAVGELVLGILIVSDFSPAASLLSTALLHLFITLTPHPNQVSEFSVFCLVRLLYATSTKSGIDFRPDLVTSTFVAWCATRTSTPGVFINLSIPLYGYLFCVATKTAMGGGRKKLTRSESVHLKGGLCFVGFAIFYSFLAQPLGVSDVSGAKPYAALRMHGGSNHLFAPTATLQPYYSPQGIVRVEGTNSTFLLSLFPGESGYLPPKAKELLLRVDHQGKQFVPTYLRMIGHERRQKMNQSFVPYTIPALELRRLLAEVREHHRDEEEPFQLTYSVLPGHWGNEAWRKYATNYSVRVVEGGSRAACKICEVSRRSENENSAGTFTCDSSELPNLPPPPYLITKTMAFLPLPVIDDAPHLACIK